MDIDIVHSALVSLTLLAEQIPSARENLLTSGGEARADLAQFLNGMERDLRMAKAALALDLGFGLCECCWPPELMATDSDGNVICSGRASTDPSSLTSSPLLASPETSNRKGDQLDAFTRLQKEKLLQLRDAAVDSVTDVARQNRTSCMEATGALALGKDEAEAGSDAYDRDFALTLLSQGQDAIREIDEALERIANGAYGVCEMSGKQIPLARLEAIPFARFTVECQAQIEQALRGSRVWQSPAPLFINEDLNGGDGEGDWEPGRELVVEYESTNPRRPKQARPKLRRESLDFAPASRPADYAGKL